MSKRAATYLDSNAGAPLQPRVVEALLPFFSSREPGSSSSRSSFPLIPNPSSVHLHGRSARRALSDARERVASALGGRVDPEQLVFTSSGTEANQSAIRGVLEPLLAAGKKPHWITTPVEHDSVLQMVEWFRSFGGHVSFLPVDQNGAPVAHALEALWRADTVLVSAIWVNNETGVVTDVPALARETRRLGGLLHLDGAQAWGKLDFDLNEAGANLVSFSGHKIGALAGTGVLWIKPGVQFEPFLRGKQEKGRRGGTENLLGLVSLGAAAQGVEPQAWTARVEPLRNAFENAICQRIPGTRIFGAGARRVPNTINLGFQGVEGDGLVMALDLSGYSVSSGAACSSGSMDPSHVLSAMGCTPGEAAGAIRISFSGMESFAEDFLVEFVQDLERIVTRIRGGSGS